MRNIKVLWGAIAVLLIAVVILSSVLSTDFFNQRHVDMSPDQTKQNQAVKVIATIGDKTITSKELEQQLLQKHGRELLNQMVDHEVIRLEGKALGMFVEDSEIQKELKRMQQGYDSEEQFYESMKVQLGLSPEALKTDIYDKLLQEKIVTKDIIVSDEQVEAYIKAHPDEFKTAVQLRIQQIVVSGKDQAAKASADISKGIDFGQVAQNRSLDDATRDNGGDLGWVEEDDPFVAAPLLKAVKQLKVGEVSKPVDWNGHLYILKLKDRKEDPQMSKEALMESVRKELALRAAPPINDVVQKLREKWKVNITF
ncbi:peptidyl-prolyl cis-trans isomerase [Paenibacillus doosanensis]|uniref:peptidylprolyl isomerase n=1 Tax=Paenibacillus konkukensis TaxID=2020716 RepID=A0ABY4RQY7_9BACL|nr:MULTISPECIES: peptidyl-prolyl cis-trans isomerase [Paenibacillus]MCS7463181.1 peptidyl-prolyl cis-trans isomerase [Paenibacillus doosanensis]UQZ84931.1 Foldase protein PrsA 1 precursor [Paenibacillus konkukensis]